VTEEGRDAAREAVRAALGTLPRWELGPLVQQAAGRLWRITARDTRPVKPGRRPSIIDGVGTTEALALQDLAAHLRRRAELTPPVSETPQPHKSSGWG
jgi:hypothetical protein